MLLDDIGAAAHIENGASSTILINWDSTHLKHFNSMTLSLIGIP